MNKGFATLVVVIILGIVSLGLSLWLAGSSALALQDGTNTKKSFVAKALVSACAEVALEAMKEDNNYTGTNIVTLNNNVCSYTIINTGGTKRTIDVIGTVDPVVRKIQVLTSAFNPLIIERWQDVP